MDIVLLHNPGAGKGELSADQLCELLRRSGFNPRYLSIKKNLDDEALDHHGEFVVVAGGDGTIRKAALRLAGRQRPLAVLPLGTANNIAASLGIAGTFEEIIAGWRNPLHRKFDLGIATGPWGTQRFVEGIGLGLATRAIEIVREIAAASEHEYESTRDELHRDLSVWFALAREISPVKLTIEYNEHVRREDCLLVEVSNIPQIGPRIPLAPGANPSDGMFDLVTVAANERETLAGVIGAQFSRSSPESSLRTDRVSRLRITTEQCLIRIDDRNFDACAPSSNEADSRITIEITIDVGALDVIVPR